MFLMRFTERAYYHYTEEDLDRPTAERVIMFGPSPAFLQYASKLLPGLDVRGVRQQTVRNSYIMATRATRSSVSMTAKASHMYNYYLDEYEYSEEVGFDAVTQRATSFSQTRFYTVRNA